MTPGRAREFLGVWAPMLIGAAVIAVAVNFYLNPGSPGPLWPAGYSWDAWRSLCSAGLVLFGIILFLSTLGRYRKARAARAEAQAAPPPRPPEGPPNP